MADAIPVHSKKVLPKIGPTEAELALERQANAAAAADAARPAPQVDVSNQREGGHGKHEMSTGVQKIMQEASGFRREPVRRIELGDGAVREDW